MGIEIDRIRFAPEDYRAFEQRLEENLVALYQLADDPGFARGPGSLGAELEMYLVDADGKPLYANQEILDQANDPQLTLELNRYNLEYNLSPYALSDAPFDSHQTGVPEAGGRGPRRKGRADRHPAHPASV